MNFGAKKNEIVKFQKAEAQLFLRDIKIECVE